MQASLKQCCGLNCTANTAAPVMYERADIEGSCHQRYIRPGRLRRSAGCTPGRQAGRHDMLLAQPVTGTKPELYSCAPPFKSGCMQAVQGCVAHQVTWAANEGPELVGLREVGLIPLGERPLGLLIHADVGINLMRPDWLLCCSFCHGQCNVPGGPECIPCMHRCVSSCYPIRHRLSNMALLQHTEAMRRKPF